MTVAVSIDKHTVALVSVIGSAFDVLGSLYLAYDLLGGEHGPLRTLTRVVSYGVCFGTAYGLAFGPVFGLASGTTFGLTLSWEFSRASQGRLKSGFWYDLLMSATRGFGFCVGATYLYGAAFGVTLGVLSTVGQVIGYAAGISPAMDYSQTNRPRFTRKLVLAALNRTVGYALAGYVSAVVGEHRERALAFGLESGLLIGVVTALITGCAPFMEWSVDKMPTRRMGVVGIGLILIGFALQSFQYWVTLLDVTVR